MNSDTLEDVFQLRCPGDLLRAALLTTRTCALFSEQIDLVAPIMSWRCGYLTSPQGRHAFHASCAEMWFWNTNKSICPYCRKVFNELKLLIVPFYCLKSSLGSTSLLPSTTTTMRIHCLVSTKSSMKKSMRDRNAIYSIANFSFRGAAVFGVAKHMLLRTRE
jgi:hypothetical protein